jgi:hypothetical protein
MPGGKVTKKANGRTAAAKKVVKHEKEDHAEIRKLRAEMRRREATQIAVIKERGMNGFRPQMPRMKGVPNPYLQTLVYPERYRGVRYPDNYGRKTAMNCLIIQVEIPYIQQGTGSVNPNTENAGDFFFVWRPSLIHPLWIYGLVQTSTIGDFAWIMTNPTDRFGVQGLGVGALTSPEQDHQMFLPNNQFVNLKMPMVFGNVDWLNDPYLVTDSQGNEFWGYTCSFGTSATPSMTVNVVVNGGVQNTDTITIQFLKHNNAASPVTLTLTATGAGQTTFTGNSGDLSGILQTEASDIFGQANTKVATRKGLIGFRIKYTGVGAPINLIGTTLLSISFLPVLTARGVYNIVQYPVDWPDQAQFIQKVTNYRPVSSSAWTSYEGSTLNDGGQMACVMYRGGTHPNQASLYNFQNISTTPESYEDKVKKGSYQYWLPASTADTQMRLPINTDEWTHPYMAIAGNMGTPGQINAVRLRAVMNMEFVSPSQVWEYQTAEYNPRMIEAANRTLCGGPTSMPNDIHLKEIYNWLKQSVKDLADWGVRNSGWLIPAGKLAMAGAALL